MEIKSNRLPFLAAIAGILPLLIWISKFKDLYWFHDDWELLNDWERLGAMAWLRQPMAENFGPVSKLLWIGAVHLTGGRYFGMILLIWITHLIVLFLFAALLVRCGFPPYPAAIAVLLAGLAWTNIEMLGWATQWSSLLCTMCLLIAWVAAAGNLTMRSKAVALAAIVIGGTMFARGIPYGVLLGIFLWLSGRNRKFAVLLAAASFLLLIPYAHLAATYPTVHGIDGAKAVVMAIWARNYILLNPLYLLISYPQKSVDTMALWIFGAAKIAILAMGLFLATGIERRVLWVLLLFDLSTAALITAGRWDTGAPGEISSRYQYVPLLCLAPFGGLIAARIVQRMPLRIALAALLAVGIALPWGRHLDRYAYERGTAEREAIHSTPDDQRFGLPSINAGRARELIAKYGLH